MSSQNKNLSEFSTENLPDISWKNFIVLVAEWNLEITESLADGAIKTLLKFGAKESHIKKVYVPGSFELSYGSQIFAQKENVDAIIALGCVIQGETKHNDYINHAVANGLTEVSLKYNKPVIFGVLTPNNLQQAIDRAGGVLGNKGDEAAITAIKMIGLRDN
jgi:6,7-dimethyl-8-ribityllumazine synthase